MRERGVQVWPWSPARRSKVDSPAIAGLIPAIPPLLLLVVTTGIVVAFGLLLNIVVERPLLKICRRLGHRRPPKSPLVPAVDTPSG